MNNTQNKEQNETQNETQNENDYIQQGLFNKTIKKCPYCNACGELASGCNYIKCPLCNGEWCWLCELPKYVTNRPSCNDKSHNSH